MVDLLHSVQALKMYHVPLYVGDLQNQSVITTEKINDSVKHTSHIHQHVIHEAFILPNMKYLLEDLADKLIRLFILQIGFNFLPNDLSSTENIFFSILHLLARIVNNG